VQAFAQPSSPVMRGWISLVAAILLAALGMNSFLKLPKNVHTMSVQPMAALIFCGYVLASMRREAPQSLARAASGRINGRRGRRVFPETSGDNPRPGKIPPPGRSLLPRGL